MSGHSLLNQSEDFSYARRIQASFAKMNCHLLHLFSNKLQSVLLACRVDLTVVNGFRPNIFSNS